MANENPYLELVTDGSQGGAGDNPYAPVVQGDTAQKVRSSVANVADINPDADAKVQKLARQYGVPVDAARLDPKPLERKAALDSLDYAELARKAPGTANFLSDPKNAAVSRDDVANMSMIESLWNETKNLGTTISNAAARGWQAQQRKWTTNSFSANARTVQDIDRIEKMIADGVDPNSNAFNLENDPLGLAQMSKEDRAKLRAQSLDLAKDQATDISIRTNNMAGIKRPAVTEKVMNADQVIDQASSFVTGELVYGEKLQGWEAFKATAAEFVKSPANFIADVGIESLVGNLDALVAALPATLAGGPALGAAVQGLGSYNTDYAASFLESLSEQGVDIRNSAKLAEAIKNPEIMAEARRAAHTHALTVSIFDGASAGVASKLALPKSLQSTLKDKPFVKELVNILLVQPPIQGTLGAFGEFAASEASGKDVSIGELFGEFFGEALGAPVEVMVASSKRMYSEFVKVDAAEENAERLRKLDELAKASKVRSRDADTFEAFVASATQDGPVQEVFIDAQTLAQSGFADQVAAVSPSVAEQFATALEAGASISIPVAEYTARIAGTELSQGLLEHLKTEPDGFSQSEAKQYMQSYAEELKADVERTLAAKQGDQAFKAQIESVKTNIKTQLDTAGRFTSQVNDAYSSMIANFYGVMAGKLGIAPDELLARYPLRIQAQSVVGQQYDQAGKLKVDTPEFKSWFGDSKIVNGDGEPLVVYHGTGSDISEFDPSQTKTVEGIFFTPNAKYASDIANARESGNVMPVYVSLKNPRIIEAARYNLDSLDAAMSDGKSDGVIVINEDGSIHALVAKTPEQIKSVNNRGTFDANDPNILNQVGIDQTDTESFKRWAGTDKPVIESNEINSFDFSGDGPFVMRGYHGTTNTFDEFDASFKGNTEGQFGAVNYFTSSEQDASDNYAGEGPDLTARIEQRAERLADEITDFYEGFENDEEGVAATKERYGEDVYSEDTLEMARNIVRKELHGGDEIVMEVFIKSEKPFVVGDVGSPWFEFFDEAQLEADAIQQVADNEGISVDDVKADFDQYSDQIDDARYELMDEAGNPLVEAVQEVATKYDFDPSDLLASLYDMAGDGTVRHTTIEEYLRQNESLSYAEDPNDGGIIQSQMIGEIIQALGFDSIILKNANVRFKNMNMEKGTAHIHVFDANNTNIKSVDNVGTFDPADPNIYKQGENANRGAFNPATNTITLLKNADLSTFLHESGHFFLETQFDIAARIAQEAAAFGSQSNTPGQQQILEDTNALLKWFGVTDLAEWNSLDFEEKRSYHEKFARGFEAYLFEGKAPSIEVQGIFQRFRAWMLNVYKDLKNLKVELTDEVRAVFDSMLATNEQIELAEQARSMMELFISPGQAGMTVEEFAAYQALGVDATNDAIQDLQARGLRDLAWARNARGREIKKLQKQAAARRAEVQMDVRREVMSQPIYRAWQFLTGKLTADDKITPAALPKSDPNVLDETIDSLFTAIAKLGGLDRAEVEGQWGFDPKERSPMPAFGKYTLRREGGLSIDAMAEALAERGYLSKDENGRFDQRELEEKFDAEMCGDIQYSYLVDERILRGEGKAGEDLNLEALGAGRFDASELGAMGLPTEIVDIIKNLKMTTKNGLHPDLVAEMFGLTSGDELVRTLAITQEPKQEINDLTDARMLELYGELATPEAIEREADKAIHNENRARVVATEANALAQATGKPKILAKAARDFARAMIAKLKIRDIRPGQYAAAEVRAAKASEKASKAGDIATAAAEKRNQLVNTYATKAAYDAQDEVENGVRYLKKFDNEGTRKNLDADYLDQIDALLERFDLRKMSLKAMDKRTALAAWLKSQEEQGFEPSIPEDLQNEAFRKPYKEMTVEELRGLVDSVKQIEHLGRLKNRLLTAAENRAFVAVRDEIAQSIEDNANGREADTRTPTTNWGRAYSSFKSFFASHIKAATWARIMDGGKDAGPVWEYFVRPANERGDMETTMRAAATIRLSEILAPVFKLGRMGGKGVFFPSINRSLNREARLAIALNTGNEGNLQRLLGGEGWTMEQILPVLSSLTATEWTAVQEIWDHFESYRPEIAAKERRVYGKEPDWVEPRAFQVVATDGTLVNFRGGYYPIKYDPAASQRAEEYADAEGAKRQLQGAFTSATTRRSFTKSRSEEIVGRPLLYTLSGLYSGVNDVIHDLAWHEWLIDANRLLRSKTIDKAMREHYGPEVKAQFKTWANDIAEGDRGAANAGEMALAKLRQGVSAAGLGFNVMSAAIQVLGFTQSIVRIGPAYVGRGIASFIANPLAAVRDVNAQSDFMANRSRTRFRELNELRNKVQDETPLGRAAKAGAFYLMMRAQQMVDVPTWLGAYDKAIHQGHNDARAVAMADQAVIDAQGGGQLKDLSAIERGGPALKLFTVFYSFMNTTFNLAVGQTMTANTAAKKAKLAADYLLLFTIPAVLGSVMKDALTPGGGDEDWDKLAKKLAAEQISYLMGTMVVVREFGEAGKIVVGAEGTRDYAGPAGVRIVGDAFKFGKQAMQGDFDDAFRKSAINLIGENPWIPLPAAQINRTITGIKALNEGRTQNPAAVLFGFDRK